MARHVCGQSVQKKKKPNSMDELCKRAKGYIDMEEMFRFRNEVRQAGKKCDKREEGTKTDSHNLDKRHKPNKRQPLPKGLRYECYIPLTANHTIILKEAFNFEVHIGLPPTQPPTPRSHTTK